MAKAARVETSEVLIGPVTETLTYLAGNGDPATVKTFGQVFHANVPKEIIGDPDGTPTQKLNMQLIETVRSKVKPDGSTWHHPSFKIGEGSRPNREPTSLPTTAEEYRAYMVDWLKGRFEHANELIARFAKDRDLQFACEVGFDDYAYLATLFMPKLHELARGDELNEPQVASMWINHGINQLPW